MCVMELRLKYIKQYFFTAFIRQGGSGQRKKYPQHKIRSNRKYSLVFSCVNPNFINIQITIIITVYNNAVIAWNQYQHVELTIKRSLVHFLRTSRTIT